MKTYIAYLRQSTMKQQISGLGVEAQREIIHNHVKNKPILAEYIETESGACLLDKVVNILLIRVIHMKTVIHVWIIQYCIMGHLG